LLVQEAGGRVTRFDGSPFELAGDQTLATNHLIHEPLMQEFAAIFAGRGLESLPDPRDYKRS
jgi:myo-inositol-1(or 4)-monophosphatase